MLFCANGVASDGLPMSHGLLLAGACCWARCSWQWPRSGPRRRAPRAPARNSRRCPCMAPRCGWCTAGLHWHGRDHHRSSHARKKAHQMPRRPAFTYVYTYHLTSHMGTCTHTAQVTITSERQKAAARAARKAARKAKGVQARAGEPPAQTLCLKEGARTFRVMQGHPYATARFTLHTPKPRCV